MEYALFDKITNSEDEMILNAGIPKRKACTYLRAYIMASLCFEPYFVISDTSVNLNRAFRTLVDYEEGLQVAWDDLPDKADFDILIKTGHIRFAARDKYKGHFSDALRKSQEKMTDVDLPGKNYTEKIDEISSDKYVYWYNLDEISRRFTSKFIRFMNDDLYKNHNILPENAKVLEKLIRRLSDEEFITYNGVKSILLNEYKYTKEDDRYKYIRGLLRRAYDSNPLIENLDYCMPLKDIKPSRKEDWKLELLHERIVHCDFSFNVYGLAKLPVSHLTYIWESPEYSRWEAEITRFREGILDLDEYTEALQNYVAKINDVVTDIYALTSAQRDSFNIAKLSRVPILIRQFMNANDKKVVIAKLAAGTWDTYRFWSGLDKLIIGDILFKILPNLFQWTDAFPTPPEKITDAVVLQKKIENEEPCDYPSPAP